MLYEKVGAALGEYLRDHGAYEKSFPSGNLVGMLQMIKNLPAMQETWVQSLGWEDPLEKKMAIYSSILAWRIPWTEEPMWSQRVGHNWATNIFSGFLNLDDTLTFGLDDSLHFLQK